MALQHIARCELAAGVTPNSVLLGFSLPESQRHQLWQNLNTQHFVLWNIVLGLHWNTSVLLQGKGEKTVLQFLY